MQGRFDRQLSILLCGLTLKLSLLLASGNDTNDPYTVHIVLYPQTFCAHCLHSSIVLLKPKQNRSLRVRLNSLKKFSRSGGGDMTINIEQLSTYRDAQADLA